MNFTRSIKKCESWVACAYMADKETIGFEHHPDRKVLYQYVYYGSAKIGKPFSSEYTLINQKGHLVDVKQFYMKDIIYDFVEDTSMWGFNTLNADDDWDGKLIEESFVGDSDSYLVCFDGNPVVNGVEMQRMDYAKLTDKKYEVELKDGLLGMFTKKFGFKLT